MAPEKQDSLEQKTEKGFVRGFGEGMYSGIERLGALLSAPIDGGESFRDNIKEMMSELDNSKNSSSYKTGLITGNVASYSTALLAGAILSGSAFVLLNRYFSQ